MQAQLSRQLRADKRAEAERLERESRRQARRDEEMRELAIKLRRKQREMRHQQNRRSSDDDTDRSGSRSSSRGSPTYEKKREDKSKSRSASPEEKRVPVWETSKDNTSQRLSRPINEHGENSNYSETRRRHQDTQSKGDRRDFDERPHSYPSRIENQKFEGQGYDNRWRENNYHSAARRPYGYRGGYKSHGFRHSDRKSPLHEHHSDTDSKNKIKLVDY